MKITAAAPRLAASATTLLAPGVTRPICLISTPAGSARTRNRCGIRAHHRAVAEGEAPALDLESGRRRVDLRLVHLVALEVGPVIAEGFHAGFPEPLDNELGGPVVAG